MSAHRMQALLFDEPATDTTRTRVGRVEIPEPAQGQVAIRVTHAGVNFKDVMARRGDPGYVRAWPFVPGLEVAGLVHAVGEGVEAPRLGEQVVAFTGEGGLAEFVIADARLTIAIPHGLAPEMAAAAVGAPLTAMLLIDEFGHLHEGETVLIHSAAGAVASAVAQLARQAGSGGLLGTVGDPTRVAAAERNGYDRVVVRGGDFTTAIRHATNGRGVDLILDPQGTTTLDADLDIAAPGARIILFGNATGTRFGPLPPLERLMFGLLSITGFSLAALAASAPERLRSALRAVLQHMTTGTLQLEITVIDGLAAASEAQQSLAEGRGATKYVTRLQA
jgi:NADPH:quinone reductase